MNKTYFWIAVTLIYSMLFMLEAGVLSKYEVLVFDLRLNWGLSVFLVQVLYTIISLQSIGPTELGARLLFGKPIDAVSSGLVFVPLGIFQLAKETRLVIQDELPADPEHIFRNEDTETVPEGMVPPIRIPFGYPKEESEDPLHRRIIAEVVIIIRWRINNYVQFLTAIGSRNEARRQLNDSAIAMLFRELAKVTPAEALEKLLDYNGDLEKTIKNVTDGDDETESWGVHIESAQIKQFNFSRGLNTDIQTIPKESAKRQSTIIAAEAEKKKRSLEGEGSGLAEKAVLRGRTAGLKKMAEGLGVSSEAVLGAETARAITENPGQKTVIAGTPGFSGLASTAAALGEALSSTKQNEEDKK